MAGPDAVSSDVFGAAVPTTTNAPGTGGQGIDGVNGQSYSGTHLEGSSPGFSDTGAPNSGPGSNPPGGVSKTAAGGSVFVDFSGSASGHGHVDAAQTGRTSFGESNPSSTGTGSGNVSHNHGVK